MQVRDSATAPFCRKPWLNFLAELRPVSVAGHAECQLPAPQLPTKYPENPGDPGRDSNPCHRVLWGGYVVEVVVRLSRRLVTDAMSRSGVKDQTIDELAASDPISSACPVSTIGRTLTSAGLKNSG
jgi:hypothetical protein